MANKKIIWNAVAIFMGALAIVCIFWGKQILASSAGASFRSALNVVDLLICLLFLFVSGVLVRIAFTRQDKTDNKKFEIRIDVGFAGDSNVYSLYRIRSFPLRR